MKPSEAAHVHGMAGSTPSCLHCCFLLPAPACCHSCLHACCTAALPAPAAGRFTALRILSWVHLPARARTLLPAAPARHTFPTTPAASARTAAAHALHCCARFVLIVGLLPVLGCALVLRLPGFLLPAPARRRLLPPLFLSLTMLPAVVGWLVVGFGSVV